MRKFRMWMVECDECGGLGEVIDTDRVTSRSIDPPMVHCDTCDGKGEIVKTCPCCGEELEEGVGYCEECDSCYECGGCKCPVCDVCAERGEDCQDFELISGERVCEGCYDADAPTQREVDREAYEEDMAEARARGEL